jgi:hypothetical protein
VKEYPLPQAKHFYKAGHTMAEGDLEHWLHTYIQAEEKIKC